MKLRNLLVLFMGGIFAACSPTVKFKASKKPITVNMNVNIEHNLRVKVEKEVEEVMKSNPEAY